ncbi:MAG: molecular chaperone TorD family protein [Bryobacteraceae bacterium]|nr:molecular chaperone TorD family protein [Bryobacteraceae bacterium]
MTIAQDTAETRNLAALYLLAGRSLLTSSPQELKAVLDDAEEALPSSAREPWRAALQIGSQDLEKEYVRLFLSPDHAACLPWQSVYADPPQLLGDAHHAALAWYRRCGMEPSRENEPADHAGLLLSFYGTLVASGAAPSELALFRRQHLHWLAGFSRKLEAAARIPLYRLAAELIHALVQDPEVAP